MDFERKGLTSFEQLVRSGSDQKYLNMLDGTTEQPFPQPVRLSSFKAYTNARDDYYRRLAAEKQNFNDAIEISSGNLASLRQQEATEREQLETTKKRFIPCRIVFWVSFVLMLVFGSGIAFGWGNSARGALLSNAGFPTFFALFSGGPGFGLDLALLIIAAIVVLLFCFFASIGDGSWGMFGLAIPGIPLATLVLRLIVAIFAYLIGYVFLFVYGFIALGIAVFITVSVLGAKANRFKIKRFRNTVVFYEFLLFVVVVASVVSSFVLGY